MLHSYIAHHTTKTTFAKMSASIDNINNIIARPAGEELTYGMSGYRPNSHIDANMNVAAFRLKAEVAQESADMYESTHPEHIKFLDFKYRSIVGEDIGLLMLNRFSNNELVNEYLINSVKDKFKLLYIKKTTVANDNNNSTVCA
jgi:hypothetical protein